MPVDLSQPSYYRQFGASKTINVLCIREAMDTGMGSDCVKCMCDGQYTFLVDMVASPNGLH